ncbi:DNA starvation/stationary phase protection protein [Mycoplasmatota bacterium]|nr:DNA starvation/stationary phase protection protein [Mycoplasmatota bacterium]
MDEKNLKKYFADLNTVLYNILNFHWNVTGGLFITLHRLYQEQYEFLFDSIDQLAEIFKAKGIYPLTCLREIYDLADIKTMESKDYTARETIESEIEQFELLNKKSISLADAANEEGDLTLVDYFTDQSNFFNKQLYFLRQFIK